MKRGMLLSLIATTAVVLGLPTAALAGGGCHGGATQQDETGKEKATVEMVDACFQASITAIDPGTDVTFVNLDQGTVHNVAGTLWGQYEDMYEGDEYTATFDEPGVYPFACAYHPGMTGAIVVGGGTGVGNGETVSTTPPDLEPVSATTTAAATTSGGTSGRFVLAAGIAGLAIGAGAAIAFGWIGKKRSPQA
jgi:plastocyanin